MALYVPSLNGSMLRYKSPMIKSYIVGFHNEHDAHYVVKRLSEKPCLRVVRSCHRILDEEHIHKYMYNYTTNRISKESIDNMKIYKGQLTCYEPNEVSSGEPWRIERHNMINMARHPVACETGLVIVKEKALVQDEGTKYNIEIIDPLDASYLHIYKF
jgi:hypothetical protein